MPWSDDDLEDREYPDEDDDDDETLTRECPQCGADVYEDAEQCPRCGAWITADTNPWKGRGWWWVALALLGTFALIMALALGGF
jgi:ribosomal protein S27AE